MQNPNKSTVCSLNCTPSKIRGKSEQEEGHFADTESVSSENGSEQTNKNVDDIMQQNSSLKAKLREVTQENEKLEHEIEAIICGFVKDDE